MAVAINRENYLLHKIQSLTGIIPVGYYMAQHLILNSYSLGGPEKFDGVINFFESLPKFFLLTTEVLLIWLPLVFHAVYGMFIVGRAKPNFIGTKYGWSQNRMYYFQRVTGVFLFFALIVHVCTTTGQKYLGGNAESLKWAAWHAKMNFGSPWLYFYLVLVLAASYHLGYGIWNFCIRWGITVSEKAQIQVQRVSLVAFAGLTLIGWGALAGFMIDHPLGNNIKEGPHDAAPVSRQIPHEAAG